MKAESQTEELRRTVQLFVRHLGLLDVRRTPCGHPLSVAQAHALMFLRAQPPEEAPPSQQVLADHLQLNKSTVTRLLRQLKSRHLVQLETCPADKRAKRIHLTEQGRQTAANVNRTSQELFGAVLSNLPEASREGVIQAVQELTLAIQQRHEGNSP
ncbi:MAG: MarR family transcriptional regulator [Deltaproteobacteria bacterium]|nr:MarR family transcriptional regulator [Deltaproteobacteria bacterium]MBT6435702.1 MarR family transcriptional regulator [Deltaproteobacteria bacterium]